MSNVFIADENETMRRGIKSVLGSCLGLRVIGEADCRGAVISELRLGRVDVLVLDPKLGGSTGEGFIRQIKAVAPATEILGFSDLDEVRYGARILRAGLKGFIGKDCGKQEFIEAVNQVSSGRPHISIRLAEALALALSDRAVEQRHERLSERELNVFNQLIGGERVSEIAESLNLSPKTVSTHKLRIMQKLGVANTSELIQYALAHNLIASSAPDVTASADFS